ncbi:CPBP family intramembrane glutamic endopeptidase [Desulfitobacterium sp. Sab5]|uniref:CPBP family intramembrane glutamic endopeptidase n=1 Tax=Desulfitobacterium nosdiversum TaxID=3375356 RepID=UPI003CF1665E
MEEKDQNHSNQDYLDRDKENLFQNSAEEQEKANKDEEEETIIQMKRHLGWIDLIIVLAGMIILFLGLGLVFGWISRLWPHEKILLYANGFLTQFMFFIMLIFLRFVRKWKWSDFGWRKVDRELFMGSVLKVYGITWLLNLVYGAFLLQRGFTPPETDVYSQLLGHATPVTFILNLLLTGLLAPIFEETLFRGVIFGGLQSYFGKITSAVLSAIIFSALHFQMYGFFPRFILGLALAYLYEKHQSLYPSMTMHSLNNVVALMLVTVSGGY